MIYIKAKAKCDEFRCDNECEVTLYVVRVEAIERVGDEYSSGICNSFGTVSVDYDSVEVGWDIRTDACMCPEHSKGWGKK